MYDVCALGPRALHADIINASIDKYVHRASHLSSYTESYLNPIPPPLIAPVATVLM